MGKAFGWIIGLALLVVAALVVMRLVDVDVGGKIEVPKVSVEGGELPNVDVDVAKVDVGATEVEVAVPEVDVDVQEKTIEVPTLEVTEEPNAEADSPQQ